MRRNRLADVLKIAGKELAGFFASPAAFLFLGAFVAATLFAFFWVETFFARNIADVRPLFQWMPILLIFLVAALTMRAWAEERRSGALELLLTAPVSPTALVLGKFVGSLALVAVALALTLPLTVSVSLLGPLDWGPVFGGYVAALALAGAYVAIGLWVSARTDNQIVSLILTAAIAGVFFLIGSDAITGLFGHGPAEWLRQLGAGSRFDAITRGVLDLRDLYYYASITAVFLVLNRLALERIRWAGNRPRPAHRVWLALTVLTVVNLLTANVWLNRVGWLRADLTTGSLYTLSDATRGYLRQVREPLVIRGYFSAETHPLLAPLVPRIRDLLAEYQEAGGSKLRVEFVDPIEDPALEEEAGSKYGIQPVPFQTTSKYQASVVNSYFDILVAYGDQFETINYADLIEIKVRSETELDVELKNPEYDITRAIRKVLADYQGGGNPFEALSAPVTFTGYVSGPQTLPASLNPVLAALQAALDDIAAEAGDRFRVRFQDPDADPALAERLTREFGFRPMAAGLLDPRRFWFYLMLSDGDQAVTVPLPESLEQAALQRSVEAALKRFSPGFLKTVAVQLPAPATPQMMGMAPQQGPRFSLLREAMSENVRWISADLDTGSVPADADMLVVLAPQSLSEKAVFAMDQFLMQGGSVVVAANPMAVTVDRTLQAVNAPTGLEDWLAHHGLSMDDALVLDAQAGALPIPVQRNIGGFTVQEIQLVDYPYIVDLRSDGLHADSPITRGLGQLYVPWASPITVDQDKNASRETTELLLSSEQSWRSDTLDLVPDLRQHPRIGFPVDAEQQRQLLGVMLEGRFDSFYADKDSPLLAESPADDADDPDAAAAQAEAASDAAAQNARIAGVIARSAESARLVLVASGSLFTDIAINLMGEALGTQYLAPVDFLQNTVDWSLEDQGLLGIRSRGHFARTLLPLHRDTQALWEGLNYALAALGLFIVWLTHRALRRRAASRLERVMQEVRV